MDPAQIDEALVKATKKRGKQFRVERATMLLEYWAFYIYRGKKNVEPTTGWSGESILTSMNTSKSYNPFCFKLLTNARQTRSTKQSSIPMGGAARQESAQRQAEQIDRLVEARFSAIQNVFLFALFVPRHLFGSREDGALYRDYEIAGLFNINPKRASEVKIRAINLVVKEMLSPIFDQEGTKGR